MQWFAKVEKGCQLPGGVVVIGVFNRVSILLVWVLIFCGPGY